jgi:hypothetical protein
VLKYLVLAIILGLTYGDAAIVKGENHVGKGTPSTQNSESDKRGTEESPLVVNQHAIQSKEEAAEEARKDAEQNRVNGWNIGLTFAIAICAGLQFLGILGQILVYWRQTKIMGSTLEAMEVTANEIALQHGEMEKQVGIMGDQVALMKRQMDIQEAEMQQWIEVGNWKAESENTARGKALRITVEIANPTSFPLTISQGQIRIAGRRQGGTITWITGDYYLIPKSPLIVTFHFQITDIEHDELFQNGRMHFDVEGSLSYIDTLKNRKTQPVGGVLTCNSKRTSLTPSAGAMEPRDSDQPQDPN